MSLDRKFRTCFISLILVLSLLSVFVIIPENVKAEESVGTTTLYFHNIQIEEKIKDENLLDLLNLLLEERILEDLYELDFENMTEDELFELLFASAYESLGKIMDQTPPTKINDSEYPLTLRTIIDECRKGNLEILYDLLTSFAPFTGVYIYTGEDTIPLKGEVTFNLYFFSPPWYFWDSDTVNVSFSIITTQDEEFADKVTGSKTIEINRIKHSLDKGDLSTMLKNPAKYKIPITMDTNLEPGDIILAEIDINPGDKPLLDLINLNVSDWNETLEDWGKRLNNSEIDFISDFGELLLNISDVLGEDFVDMDFAEILQQMISSSFIFDSTEHKSSLTLPCKISGEDENTKVYYLHDKNQMNEEIPEKDKPSSIVLSKESGKWDGPDLNRNKILKKATANLFIDHLDLRRLVNILRGKIKVKAVLVYEDEEIASSEKELDRNSLLALLQKPDEPTTFNFNLKNETEITYDTHLILEMSVSSGTKFGLGLLRNVKLLYDSKDYPSSLTVEFDETDHIKIDADQLDKKVALGGSVEYTLNITSDFDDDISITVNDFSKDEDDKWDIEIVPESFSIDEGGQQTVDIMITSTDTDLDAYDRGDILDVTFVAAGKTGKDMFDAMVEISEDAVEYDIVVTAEPLEQEIKHGQNGTYLFKIKNNNTGLWPDSYTIEVSSENDWDINTSYDEEDLENLAAGDEAEIEVTLFVPKYTDISSDMLTFTVEGSKKSVTLNVTTVVIGPNILESLYGFFESAAEDLGLDGVFGSYAVPFLIFITVFLIIFFIILLVYFLIRKFVIIVCLGRIKEISPDEEARFEITIQNPTKKTRTYELSSQENPMSPKWDTSLDPREVMLEPGQSKTVVLTVKPTKLVKSDDWIEVDVVVNTVGKQKLEKLTTMTMIKDAKVELNITGVFHWPKVFKKGDRVTTSFKLENRGNVSASNVTVVLYVNGEEKNKVEDVTIPSGGYADIEMPWIAVKGKNEVNIVVK